MRIAYLECATGISGDMVLAALIDAGVDEAMLQKGIDSLGLPNIALRVEEVMKGCFRAKKVTVEHEEQHAHRHLSDIVKLIRNASAITPQQQDLAIEIFQVVAEAEASVHGESVERIHFHEVGAIDSIVDIVGAAIGFDLLGVDQVVCAPLPTGRGEVLIAHGICPIPTPGTAEILKGLPIRDLPVQAELTTPTGAAIVKVLANRFGALPEMRIEQIGSGAGTMDIPDRANILRLFVGEAVAKPDQESVCLLETNLDDISPEVIGYTKERLLQQGALDVYTIPIQMKKNRPAVILSVLCREQDETPLTELIFRETGTLGVRRQLIQRSVRARREHTVLTSFGSVTGKLAWQPGGHAEFSPEFEDCARLAQETGRPLREIYRLAELSFFEQQGDVTATRPESHAKKELGHHHDHSHDHSHDHDHGHSHDHDHDHGH